MAKDELVPTELELWNNAKLYSLTHVAEPLIRCRKLIMVCLFGVEELGEEINFPETVLNSNKILSLKRLLQELKQIMDDNYSFLDKKGKETCTRLKTELEAVEKVMGGISYYTSDQRNSTKEIKLNEEHYGKCLSELRSICSGIKPALGNLIFASSGDYDLEKIKKEIMLGG